MSNVRFSVDHTNRVPINIHPAVRTRLNALLMTHADLQGSGIGYSEFIADAIEAFERGLWQCGRDGRGFGREAFNRPLSPEQEGALGFRPTP